MDPARWDQVESCMMLQHSWANSTACSRAAAGPIVTLLLPAISSRTRTQHLFWHPVT